MTLVGNHKNNNDNLLLAEDNPPMLGRDKSNFLNRAIEVYRLWPGWNLDGREFIVRSGSGKLQEMHRLCITLTLALVDIR